MTIKKTMAILLLSLLIICVNASLKERTAIDDLSIKNEALKYKKQHFEYRKVAEGMYEDIAGNIIEFTDDELQMLNLE